MADKAAEGVQNMNVQDYDSSEFDPLSPQNCNGGSFPFTDTQDLDLLSGQNPNVGNVQNGHGKSVVFDDEVIGLQENSDQAQRSNSELFQRHMSEGEILGYQNEYGDSVTHQLEYGLDSDDEDDNNLVNFKPAENRTPYYPPVDHDYLISTGQPLLDIDNVIQEQADQQDLGSEDQFEDSFEDYPGQDSLENNSENNLNQCIKNTCDNNPEDTFEDYSNVDSLDNNPDQNITENCENNIEDTSENYPSSDPPENNLQEETLTNSFYQDTYETSPRQSLVEPSEKYFDESLEQTFENNPDRISEDIFGKTDNLVNEFEQFSDKIEEKTNQSLEGKVEGESSQRVENKVEEQSRQIVKDKIEEQSSQIIEEKIEKQYKQIVEDKVKEQISQRVEDKVEEQSSQSVEDKVKEQINQSVEGEIEEQYNHVNGEKVEEQSKQFIEDKVEEQSRQCVEDTVEEQSSQSVEDKLEEQSRQSVEDKVEEQTSQSIEDTFENNTKQSLVDLSKNKPGQNSLETFGNTPNQTSSDSFGNNTGENSDQRQEDIIENKPKQGSEHKSDNNPQIGLEESSEIKSSKSVEQYQQREAMEDNVYVESADAQYAAQKPPEDYDNDNIDPNEWHPQMDEERSRRSLSPERSVSPLRQDYSQSEGAEGVSSPQCDTESYENFDSEDISSFSEPNPNSRQTFEPAIPYSPEHSDASLVDRSETESVTSDASGMSKTRSGVPRLRKPKKVKELPPWNDNVVIPQKPRMRPTFIGNKEYLHTASSSPDRPQTAPAHFIAKDASSDSGVEDENTRTQQNSDDGKKKYGTDSKNARYKPGGGQVQIFNQKVDTKHIAPRTDTKIPKSALTPRSPVKSPPPPRATTPNTRQVQSKIGSLNNVKHSPGGGNIQILSAKPDFSNVKSKVGSKDKIDHKPKGGDKKIESKKLEWKVESKVGSLKNATHSPGGGNVKKSIVQAKATMKPKENIDYIREDGHSFSERDLLSAESMVETGQNRRSFSEFDSKRHRFDSTTHQIRADIEIDGIESLNQVNDCTDMTDGYAQTTDIDRCNIYTQCMERVIENQVRDTTHIKDNRILDLKDGYMQTIDVNKCDIYTQHVDGFVEKAPSVAEETVCKDMTDGYMQTKDVETHDIYTQHIGTGLCDGDTFIKEVMDCYIQTMEVSKHDIYTQHDKAVTETGCIKEVNEYTDGGSNSGDKDMKDGYMQTMDVNKCDIYTQHINCGKENKKVDTLTLDMNARDKNMIDGYAQTNGVSRQDNATSMDITTPPPKPLRCILKQLELEYPKESEPIHGPDHTNKILYNAESEPVYAVPQLRSNEGVLPTVLNDPKQTTITPGQKIVGKIVNPISFKGLNSFETLPEKQYAEIEDIGNRKRHNNISINKDALKSTKMSKSLRKQQSFDNSMINIINDKEMNEKLAERKLLVESVLPITSSSKEGKENTIHTDYSSVKKKGFGSKLRSLITSRQKGNDRTKEDKEMVYNISTDISSKFNLNPENSKNRDDLCKEKIEIAKHLGYVRPYVLQIKSSKDTHDKNEVRNSSQQKRTNSPIVSKNCEESMVSAANLGCTSPIIAKNKTMEIAESKQFLKENGLERNKAKGLVKRMAEKFTRDGKHKGSVIGTRNQTKDCNFSVISGCDIEIDLSTTGRVTGSYDVNTDASSPGITNQAFDYDRDSDVDSDEEREISFAEITIKDSKPTKQKQALQTTTFKYKLGKRPASQYTEIKHELVSLNKTERNNSNIGMIESMPPATITYGKRIPVPPVMHKYSSEDKFDNVSSVKCKDNSFKYKEVKNHGMLSSELKSAYKLEREGELQVIEDLEKSFSDELKDVLSDCERKYLRNQPQSGNKLLQSGSSTPKISVKPIRLKAEEGVKLLSYSSSFSNQRSKRKEQPFVKSSRGQSMIVKRPQNRENFTSSSITRAATRILIPPENDEEDKIILGLKAGVSAAMKDIHSEKFGFKSNIASKDRSIKYSEPPCSRILKTNVTNGTDGIYVDRNEMDSVMLDSGPVLFLDKKTVKKENYKLQNCAVSSQKMYENRLPVVQVNSATNADQHLRQESMQGSGHSQKLEETGVNSKTNMPSTSALIESHRTSWSASSRIGSLDNATHVPGGGKKKIESHRPTWSATSRVGSLENATHVPGGGKVKILDQPLEIKAQAKVGSTKNLKHKPGGGDKKIETQKLEFTEKAKSKVGSMDKVKHQPGGGDIKIIDEKLKWEADSKVESLVNVTHVPGGGEVKILDEKLDFTDKAASKVGSMDKVKHKPGGGDKKIETVKLSFKETARSRTDTGAATATATDRRRSHDSHSRSESVTSSQDGSVQE